MIIDISWPITNQMSTYKNRNDVRIAEDVITSEYMKESSFSCHSHTGTHVDAPAHFIKNGKTVDKIQFDQLCRPVYVIDMTQCNDTISQSDLEDKKEIIVHNKAIIFKTRNSFLEDDARFNPHFVYLDKTAAQFLHEHGVTTVGFDYLGIERNQPEHETHKILLTKGIVIEGLRLKTVEQGLYHLYCLPLLLYNMDAAPARAFLTRI